MTAVFITVFLIYFFLLLFMMMGWNRITRSSSQKQSKRFCFISVIVPFRNDESSLPLLIESLHKQEYSREHFEVLLIDDHSEDDSARVAREVVNHSVHFKVISAKAKGKKAAITQAIENSMGEIIATTDADCLLPPQWLTSVNKQFQDPSTVMAIGAVRIQEGSRFFSTLQAMEFTSLMGSAAATLMFGFPTMCNGASLSYRKEAFARVSGYAGNEQVASGDDEFLMRKIADRFGSKSITFLKDKGVVVTTAPQSTLTDFFRQRFRWAGKWRYNSDRRTIALAIFIFIFQCTWLTAAVTLILQRGGNTIVSLFVVKVIMEGFFLLTVSKFMSQRFSLVAFLTLQVVYPLYVVVVGLMANFVPISWKGRRIQHA